MNTNNGLHVVLGATGGIGSALVETMYQFEKPFYAASSKYERSFGPFDPTPREGAIARIAARFRKRGDS